METCSILFYVCRCRYRGCRQHSGSKKSHCSDYFVCSSLEGNARCPSRHLPPDCKSSNEIWECLCDKGLLATAVNPGTDDARDKGPWQVGVRYARGPNWGSVSSR